MGDALPKPGKRRLAGLLLETNGCRIGAMTEALEFAMRNSPPKISGNCTNYLPEPAISA